MATEYPAVEPSREEVDRLAGPLVLEFGAEWCGYCQAARPHVQAALDRHPGVRHLWIEDGKGKHLGRSFRVKLWPTLVFLRDGQVKHQVARPDATEIEAGFTSIVGTG
jgi:thioredoxin 1